VEPYVRILGREGAVRFLLAFGGTELYLPRRPRQDHPLVAVVGHKAARDLGAAAPSLPRRVPIPKRWLAQTLDQDGLSVAQIARKLHVTDVTVRDYLRPGGRTRQSDPDPRQTRLQL